MELKREQLTNTKTEFVLYLAPNIPLYLNDLFFKVAVFALVALAYNVGVHDASEYLKWAAYFSQHNTIYDYNAGIQYTCIPNYNQEGNNVRWNCETKNISVAPSNTLGFINN